MRKLAIIISVVLLLSSCSSTKITTDQVSNIDYSKYDTYTVAQVPNINGQQHINAINAQRVQNAIQNELSQRQLLLSEDPKLQIVWGFDVDVHKSYTTNTNHYRNGGVGRRGRGGYGMATSHSDTQEYDNTTGVLQVAVIDTSSEEVIWIGTAEDNFKGNNKKAEEKINGVLEKVFEEFPIDKTQS